MRLTTWGPDDSAGSQRPCFRIISGLATNRRILHRTAFKARVQTFRLLTRSRQLDLRWVNSLPALEWFQSLEARGCVVYR
jgi:hypothetical protein